MTLLTFQTKEGPAAVRATDVISITATGARDGAQLRTHVRIIGDIMFFSTEEPDVIIARCVDLLRTIIEVRPC